MDINLREIILNVKEPIVIKNFKLDWTCFKNKSFEEWCKEYSEEIKTSKLNHKIDFVSASRKYSDRPQWEKYRNKIPMTVEDFYNDATSQNNTFFQNNWAAINYKSIEDIPKNCRSDINFNIFGFPDIREEDITFWLSSSGAHTPCHYDTYGSNIVVQVYGRKMWLLFPPEANLTPVRVPYEESSVYCSETFYSPKNIQQFENIKTDCYQCILEEGDVLIVPRLFWHYVENLQTSLSINYWVPLETDTEMQLDECIIKLLIEKFIQNTTDDNILNILNPNQISEVSDELDTLNILKVLTQNLIKLKTRQDKISENRKLNPYQYLTNNQVLTLIKDSKWEIECLKKISSVEFLDQMNLNSERFEYKIVIEDEILKIKIILINSICNPDIIKNIRNLYLNNIQNQLEFK